MSRLRVPCAWVWLLAFALGPVPARTQSLQTTQSRHYTLHTNLPQREAQLYARHMDAVYSVYQQRFAGFRPQRRVSLPLYLFDTQPNYTAFLSRHGIDATNSGGMFFVTPTIQGLATFVRDRQPAEVLSVLQHEGFHQFAWTHIGPELPIWANEGIAQYFEDGVLVGDRLLLGMGDATRIDLVKQALTSGRAVPFKELLTIDGATWGTTLNTQPERAVLLYAQSWSVVDLLVSNRRYQAAFEKYLQLISRNTPSGEAFVEAFGNDSVQAFEERWREHALAAQPDDFALALSRLHFLARAVAMLAQQGVTLTTSMDALRERLRSMGFVSIRQTHGLRFEMHASDADNFRYLRPGGAQATFVLLEPQRNDLPPRISAPGLRPEPTVTWDRDATGSLVYALTFR